MSYRFLFNTVMALPPVLALTKVDGWLRRLATPAADYIWRKSFKTTGKGPTPAEVQAELINTLFRPSSIILAIQGITSTVLAWLLWPRASHAQLLGWLVFIYSLLGVRRWLVHAYRRRRPALDQAPHWGLATSLLSGLSGLAWGATPILFLDAGQQPNLVIITVTLIGLNAQALMAVVSYPPAYFASMLPLLSLLAMLLWRGGPLGKEVALLVILNLAASLFYARNIYRALTNSLHLTFENTALRRETEEKSALLEATLQNMQQGISVVDQDGRLRMWNQRFMEIFQLPAQELAAGERLDAALPGVEPLAELDGKQIERRSPDDGVIEIRQNVMPDGGRVLTYTDISELKHREEALQTAREVAERANAAKTRFLAAASHDLRQPIHALGLFFAKLADQVRNGQTETLIKQIEDAIDAIDSMLNALLDISKLDAGVIHPAKGPVSVAGLFKRLESEYQPLARETGNVLRVRPCEARVASDPALLECVLRNLLSNALRYTQDGRVLLAARYRGDKLRLEVYDTGSGIPADQLDNIFLEFHQLQRPERDRRPGLGLGLAIVKRVTLLLEHDIEVCSEVGRGSRFAVMTPLLREASAPHPLSIPLAQVTGLQGRRILVLDDDPAVLEAMAGLLESWGCVIIMATSLEEAQAKLQAGEQPPELLIIDYRLRGEVSGLEAVTILHRQMSRYVPALIITADTAPECLREAQASGYPLLHKPVQPAKLHSAVHFLVGMRRVKLR